MDYELERVENWKRNFTNFLMKDNADLIPLYAGRIIFIPQQDRDNSINPALNELDERYATADQIKRMWDVLKDYAAQHPV